MSAVGSAVGSTQARLDFEAGVGDEDDDEGYVEDTKEWVWNDLAMTAWMKRSKKALR